MSFPDSFSVYRTEKGSDFYLSVYKLYLPDQTTHSMEHISVMANRLVKRVKIPCPPQRSHSNNASKISENVQQTIFRSFVAILWGNDDNFFMYKNMELKDGIL